MSWVIVRICSASLDPKSLPDLVSSAPSSLLDLGETSTCAPRSFHLSLFSLGAMQTLYLCTPLPWL